MTVLLFFLLIGFVFWIASLHDRPDFEQRAKRRLVEQSPGRHASGSARSSSRRRGSMPMSARWCRRRKCSLRRRRILGGDLTTADMVKVGREIMEGKGLCLTCHTIGKTGALRFPDLAGVDVRAKTRVPGLSDVEYFAQSMYEPDAYIVPGFPPAMPAINKPPIGLTDQEILCVIAYLQTLGGTPTVTLQTKHHYNSGAAAPAGSPAPAAAPAPGREPPRHRRARRNEASRSSSPWSPCSRSFASVGPTC